MKITKYLNVNTASIAGFVLFAYWLLAVRNGFMLRWYDEMSLFEPTGIFFRQFLYYPGGLLRYAGTWLTQLMYYPWLGSAALLAMWIVLAWLTLKAFRLSKGASPLSLLVPVCMLVSVVQLDEAWLSLKTPGYIYSNTLGYIFTLLIMLIYRGMNTRPLLSAAIAAFSALCYPIAGFYALLGAALCAAYAVSTAVCSRKYIHLTTTVIAIFLIVIIPQLYYTYLPGNTVDNDLLYLKGLPELMMEGFDLYLWMPFIVASAIMLVLASLSACRFLDGSRTLRWVAITAVCLGLVWSFKASRKSEQLRATVLMLQRLDRNDWQGINAVMSRIKEPPSYTMKLLDNLALTRLGRKEGRMTGLSPANGDGRHSEKFTMTAFANVPVLYHIGRVNQSYQWAMEHTVQYGKRVFFLKYMVKDALVRGEIGLAKRYNDILMQTMFHRKWAQEMNRYIEDPELISRDPQFQPILQTANTEE